MFPPKPKWYKMSQNPSNHLLAVNYSRPLPIFCSHLPHTNPMYPLQSSRQHVKNRHICSFVRYEGKGRRHWNQDSVRLEWNVASGARDEVGNLFNVLSHLGLCPSHPHHAFSKKALWNFCEASVSIHCQRWNNAEDELQVQLAKPIPVLFLATLIKQSNGELVWEYPRAQENT